MIQHRPAREPTEQCEEHIGILFVHGIGAQRRGETLARFGAPIYRWLIDRFHGLDLRWREAAKGNEQLERWRARIEYGAVDILELEASSPQDDAERPWLDPETVAQLAEQIGCNTVVGRVSLADAVINDPEDPGAPAHAQLRFRRQRVDGRLEAENWLLAESWWAETFSPPRFSELARWGLRVIPWTVGSHFGAHVRRILARPRETSSQNRLPSWLRRLGWLLDLLASFAGLIAALTLVPLLLAIFAGLLLVALLPFPSVREALLKLQLKIASTVGDSYVLVSRPIEAASIIGQVRRDLRWLASRCKAVVVVAHSQGGAVAHKALKSGAPPELRLLFTFGSGLKKLEQLEYLLSSGGSYRRSAALTLTALALVAITVAWLLWACFGGLATTGEPITGVMVVVAWAVVGSVILVAGLRDLVRGIELRDLKRWIRRLGMRRLSWVDCFATADPVSNGILFEDPAIEALSEEVCNESSILKDHTTYWENRDQFVTLLIDRLARPDVREEAGLPPAPDLSSDRQFLDWLGARRRWRVGIRSAIDWVALCSVLLAVIVKWSAYHNLLIYSARTINSWVVGLFGMEPKPVDGFTLSWPALGYLVLVLVPYLTTRHLWRRWNDVEMRTLIQGGWRSARHIPVLTGLWVQLALAGGLVYRDVPPFWLVMVFLVGVVVPTVVLEPSPRGGRKAEESSGESDRDQSLADVVWRRLVSGLVQLALPFALGMAGWDGFVWVVDRLLGGSLFAFRPGEVSSYLVGTVVALVYTTGLASRRVVRAARDRRPQRPG